MQDVIRFLDRLGQDAALRHATLSELEQVMRSEGLEPTIRSAILQKDTHGLATLLGANHDLCCMIAIPREDEDADWYGDGVRSS
jgi:hypothetical protein